MVRDDGGMTPRSLFRALAVAELVTWTMLLVGMLMKYGFGLGDLPVRIGGSVHGFVFLAYLVVTTVVAVNQRWSFGTLALGWASAVVPYTTLPFEVGVARRGMLDGPWRRSAPAGTQPGFWDRLLFSVVRRPAVAVVVGVVLVVLVFVVLLTIGPPVPSR
ncbi:integral membrane protein [Curtobacterium sp. 9128]|nr:integral membrane protein [Curtobacterium sp. 9128]